MISQLSVFRIMRFSYKNLITVFFLQFLIFSLSAKNKDGVEKQIIFEKPVTLTDCSLDGLVLQGIKYIYHHGKRFKAHAGSGLQAYNVSYVLLNPKNRLHNIRKPKAVKYFCRELLAYFKGSLNVNDGLAQASSVWKNLANKNQEIASNYGYYVFHQKISEKNNLSQYEWVIQTLVNNIDSRKAFININQPIHKVADKKDFPCTIGMQFFVENDYLCCVVSSRSTDIYTGLPYDIGFFSFVTELVYKDLKERIPEEKSINLKLGYVMMKTTFTQIYDKTCHLALALLNKPYEPEHNMMPQIEDAKQTLSDIYQQTANTPVLQWIYENSQLLGNH